MFTIVSIWRTDGSATGEMMRARAQTELMPMVRAQSGFVDYRSMTVLPDRFVVVHTWRTRQDAMDGMRQNGEWAMRYTPDIMRLERIITGEIVVASFEH